MPRSHIHVANLDVNLDVKLNEHDTALDALEARTYTPARVLRVGQSWPVSANPHVFFTSIQSAITAGAALTPTSTNPVVVVIAPGMYTETITAASNVYLWAHNINSVYINGTFTWNAGAGANASLIAAIEFLGLQNINIVSSFVVNTTAKSAGLAAIFAAGCYLQGSSNTLTGRGTSVDEQFFYHCNFLTANQWTYTNCTGNNGAPTQVGPVFVGCRNRGFIFAGNTIARVQGGERLAGAMTLSGTASALLEGVNVGPIALAAGTSVVTRGCDHQGAVTGGGVLDMRSSTLGSGGAISAAFSGTVNRTAFNGQSAPTSIGSNSVALTPKYPDAIYNVQLQLVSGPGDVSVNVGSKAGGSFVINDAVGGNVWDYTVTHA